MTDNIEYNNTNLFWLPNFENPAEVASNLENRINYFYTLLESVKIAQGPILPQGFIRDYDRGRTSFKKSEVINQRREFEINNGSLEAIHLYAEIIVKDLHDRVIVTPVLIGSRTPIEIAISELSSDSSFIKAFLLESSKFFKFLNTNYKIEYIIENIYSPVILLNIIQAYIQDPNLGNNLSGTNMNCPATTQSIKESMKFILCYYVCFYDFFEEFSDYVSSNQPSQ